MNQTQARPAALPDSCRDVLIVRLSSVGDIVLASPVAESLRRRYPQARIHWLVDAGYEALLAGNPHLDRVLAFDYTGRHRGPAGIRSLVGEIGPVDLLVDLQHKVRTALVTRALRPAHRRVLVKRRGLDLVRALVGRDPILRGPHQTTRYLQLVDEVGDQPPGPRLCADAELVQAAAGRLRQALGSRPVIGLVPSTRHWTKQWPQGHVRDLASRCLDAGWGVVLLGGRDEAADMARMVGMLGPGAFAHGGPGLDRLAALLACCRVVVCPDSGPGHMAAALGVPLVSLFGPTSEERWAPIGRGVTILRRELACSPCSNHGGATCPVDTLQCMRELEPAAVFGAVAARLEAER